MGEKRYQRKTDRPYTKGRNLRQMTDEQFREYCRMKGREHRGRQYGLTPDQVHAVYSQGCAICSIKKNIALDHCHATQNFRDALCSSCNRGLGYFHDDPLRLVAAAEYVRKHQLLS